MLTATYIIVVVHPPAATLRVTANLGVRTRLLMSFRGFQAWTFLRPPPGEKPALTSVKQARRQFYGSLLGVNEEHENS